MSHEQLSAYHTLMEHAEGEFAGADTEDNSLVGRVMILTGAAGTGKSTVINWLRAASPPGLLTVCATTGSAAILVGGYTVDRLFCFERDSWQVGVQRLLRTMNDSGACIVIDEASMIGAGMAGAIEEVLGVYRNKRVILVGDWAQASPVKDDWPFERALFKDATLLRLTTCHRQDDPEYLSALRELRSGTIPPYFRRCNAPPPSDSEACVRAYATNQATDARNKQRYAQLRKDNPETPEWQLRCKVQTRIWDEEQRCLVSGVSTMAEWAERKAIEQSGLADMLPVCVGTRVIIVRNAKELVYVNGDTGTIEAMSDLGITVRLDRTKKTVLVEQAAAEIKETVGGQTMHVVQGYPLRYGWAVTIHRMQGMTLPRVHVELETLRKMPPPGRHGLAYVALSRTKNIEGLTVDNASAPVAVCARAVEALL
jgi:ATP-dependent exoDNAse (exonuclease V) alpha subunit